MASPDGIDRISLVQLRASLSLVLPPGDVDAVVAGLPETIELVEHRDHFARAVYSARFRLLKQRLLGYLRIHSEPDSDSERSIAHSLREHRSESALLLALHLGTGLTSSQLAEMLDRPGNEIAHGLATLRLSLFGTSQIPCQEWAGVLGAYRDAHVDLLQAASIARHRASCQTCRATLDEFERLDDELVQEIEAVASSDTPAVSRRGGLVRRYTAIAPLILIIALVMATLVASAGVAGSFSGSASTPLYASEPAPNPGGQGWIIYGTWDGGLHAFDPINGTREILLPEYYTAHIQDGANYLVSPDGERVAIFAQADVAGLHWATRQVRVVEITGEEINTLEWGNALDSGWPTGWLGEDELLIASIPVYEGGETTERFLQRLEAKGHLRAVNIHTGEQRTVYRGAVAQVIPSPDGSRLAIVRPRDPAYPGTTVDLWSVEDGEAADHLGSIGHSFTWNGGLLWDPASEALFLGQIAEAEDQRSENSRDDAFRGHVTSINIVRLDRDGDWGVVTEPAPETGNRLVAVDSRRILYAEFAMPGSDTSQTIYSIDRSTGERVALDLPDDEMRFRPTQSGTLGYQNGFVANPDGSGFMLHLESRHYLRIDPAQHYGETPSALYLTKFDEQLDPQVATVISDRWPLTPLGWLTSAAVEPQQLPDIDHASMYASPERVGELRSYAQLGRDSTASPDGAALPMVEALDEGERPYLWFPLVETGRWIASQTSDLSWHASSHAFFGVTRLGGENGGMSRITQHSASQRGGSSVDGFFDPLSLAEQHEAYYAAPSASPDATRTSFFTIDTESKRVSLWLADWLEGTSEVHSFRFPEDAAEQIAPFSVWLDNQTLIFAEPLEWSRQVPSRVALQRLTLKQDGVYEIEPLLDLSPSGRDRGIDIVEVAVQPGGEYISWRVRHYTDSLDPSAGGDSVQIAPTSDLSDAVEIDRASMTTGLTWSPHGQALAIDSGGRIAVYSVETHSLAHVSGDTREAAHPAWLSERELWFNAGPTDDAEVYRVRFGD